MTRWHWTTARIAILRGMEGRGASAEEIAGRLGCAVATVEEYLGLRDATPRRDPAEIAVAAAARIAVDDDVDVPRREPRPSRSTPEERLAEMHPLFRKYIARRFGVPQEEG